MPSPPQEGDAPASLGTAGQRLWQAVDDLLELAEHERAILLAAARAADRLEQISAALADAPLVVTNYRGDQVSHPLLAESRQTALLLARLCAALNLPAGLEPDSPFEAPGQDRSKRSHRPGAPAQFRGVYRPGGSA
jgi:hypothetical protein